MSDIDAREITSGPP